MEPDPRYTIVGIVVIALIALTVAAALWIRKSGVEGDTTYFLAYFGNQSLSGLQVDSNVTMKGIKVGSVRSVEISLKDIERVKVLLEIYSGTPIKTDTTAVINRNLLTGLANIDLVGSTQNAPLLEERPAGERYPVIPEGQTRLEVIQSTLPELLERANEMVSRASTFLSEENAKAASAILTNLDKITASAAKGQGDLTRALEEISNLAGELRTLVTSLEQEAREVSGALRGASYSITQEATRVGQDLSLTLKKIGEVMDNFSDPGSLITGPADSELGPGE